MYISLKEVSQSERTVKGYKTNCELYKKCILVRATNLLSWSCVKCYSVCTTELYIRSSIFSQWLMAQHILNLRTSVIKKRVQHWQWAYICHVKRKRIVFIQVFKTKPRIKNEFHKWISSIFRSRDDIYNLWPTKAESNLKDCAAQKPVVSTCLFAFVLCDGDKW